MENLEKIKNTGSEQRPASETSVETPIETLVKKEGFWSTREDLKKLIKEKGNWGALKKVLFNWEKENLKEKIERIKKENKVAEKPMESVSQSVKGPFKSSIDIESRIKVAEPRIIDVIENSGGGELTYEEKEEMRKIAEDNKIDIISSNVEAEDNKKETGIKAKAKAKDIKKIEDVEKNEDSEYAEIVKRESEIFGKFVEAFENKQKTGKDVFDYLGELSVVYFKDRSKYVNVFFPEIGKQEKLSNSKFDKLRIDLIDSMIDYLRENDKKDQRGLAKQYTTLLYPRFGAENHYSFIGKKGNVEWLGWKHKAI